MRELSWYLYIHFVFIVCKPFLGTFQLCQNRSKLLSAQTRNSSLLLSDGKQFAIKKLQNASSKLKIHKFKQVARFSESKFVMCLV